MIAEIDEAIAEYEGKPEVSLESPPMASGQAVAPFTQSPIAPALTMSVDSPSKPCGEYFGMSIAEAAATQLRALGRPLLTKEISEALLTVGFQIMHSDPAHAVHNQLTKRSKREGDVIFVGGGRWGLKEWYTKAELEGIEALRGGMPGRDVELHKKKVREAIDAAKARGARFGRPTFNDLYSDEDFTTYRRLRAEGKSVKEALAAIKMPYPTYRKYKDRIEGEADTATAQNSVSIPEKVVPIRRRGEV